MYIYIYTDVFYVGRCTATMTSEWQFPTSWLLLKVAQDRYTSCGYVCMYPCMYTRIRIYEAIQLFKFKHTCVNMYMHT